MIPFLKQCGEQDNALLILAWKLLSFFALENAEQAKLIGSTDEWFVKEDSRHNPGANYLFGMLVIADEYAVGSRFFDWAPIESSKISVLVASMIEETVVDRKRIYIFQTDPSWYELRNLAAALLEKSGAWVNPPDVPYFLPEMTEIWWESYRNLLSRSDHSYLPYKR
jgi:hypothetical protein